MGYGIVRGGEMRKRSKKRRRIKKRTIKKRKRRFLPDPFGVRRLSKSNNTVVIHMNVCIYNWFIPFRIVARLFLEQWFEASHSSLRQCIKMQHKPKANAIFFLSLRTTCDHIPLNELITYKSLFFLH
jgi:hypothetical protein